MTDIALLSFAIQVIGPVVLLIAFGYLLYKTDLMNEDFVGRASRLIFNFALPALLFSSISRSELALLDKMDAIAVGVVGTLSIVCLLILVVPFIIRRRADRGVVMQGAFRANLGIVGLAYCANAYGEEGLVFASVYLGALTIVYNFLSVIILHYYSGNSFSLGRITKSIITNPIILSIVLALAVNYFSVPVPAIIGNSIGYFAQLTLPLALLCTGASLRFSSLHQDAYPAIVSISVKVLLYPIVVVGLALCFDLSGMILGIVYLMAVCPTAAASYVMTRKIGGNHQLAAHIVAFSTLVSVPTTIIGYGLIAPWLS